MNPPAPRRFQLSLRKPRWGWFPKPTVTVDGVAQPAHWGERNWKVPGEGAVVVEVFVFNRLWKFGAASLLVEPGPACALIYTAPRLPFGPGSLRQHA